MTNQEILALEFESMDLSRKLTIKDYLKELLITLWKEGECFSGKRPFGNSSWQYEMYHALVKHGVLVGKLDEDGYLEEYDIVAAKKLMVELITSL